MSQNSTTLLLFFDNQTLCKNYLLLFNKLNESKNQEAESIAEQLNIDISKTWQEDWFNHHVTAQPLYIRIDYDASTSYHLPLNLLKQLFESGLISASLEIFYDQVGEFSQHYFINGKLDERDAVFNQYPIVKDVSQSLFECAYDELEDEGIDTPVSIIQLIKNEEKAQKESQEMVDSIVELAKLSKDTGSNPMELLKSVLLLRALGKGLVYAIIFGVVTVLLFKGMWLWISLSIILAIVLPVYYISKVSNELSEDSDDLEEEGEEIYVD